VTVIHNWGFICLAIFLIITGIEGLFGFTLGALQIIIPILALVAGILILFGI
jgi:hypothetical protein